MLDFKPITIAAPETTPLTYNVSLIGQTGETIFSESFFVRANDLQIELINNATGAANGISVYGPDVSDPITGTYHVIGNLFETSDEYAVRAEIVAVGDDQREQRIVDDFRMQVNTSPAAS